MDLKYWQQKPISYPYNEDLFFSAIRQLLITKNCIWCTHTVMLLVSIGPIMETIYHYKTLMIATRTVNQF